MKKIKLALVGATGLIGNVAREVLTERNLPIDEYFFVASERSKGKKIKFMNKEYEIYAISENFFKDNKVDYAIFCAGGSVSRQYAPIAQKYGTIVIDNSSEFRMDKDVPLVVPEVNPENITNHKGIIANPNCSTIQAMLPLKVIDDLFGIERVVYSTYQAVSGAGMQGIQDLEDTIKGLPYKKFQYSIIKNCIPHIDVFLENGYTKEEMKMVNESRKILGNDKLRVTATTVRVPIRSAHSESINVECKKEIDLELLKEKLSEFNGIILEDDVTNNKYPLAQYAEGRDEVFVGRLRYDESIQDHKGLNFWCVADNTRKGAATNAVQILEWILNNK